MTYRFIIKHLSCLFHRQEPWSIHYLKDECPKEEEHKNMFFWFIRSECGSICHVWFTYCNLVRDPHLIRLRRCRERRGWPREFISFQKMSGEAALMPHSKPIRPADLNKYLWGSLFECIFTDRNYLQAAPLNSDHKGSTFRRSHSSGTSRQDWKTDHKWLRR